MKWVLLISLPIGVFSVGQVMVSGDTNTQVHPMQTYQEYIAQQTQLTPKQKGHNPSSPEDKAKQTKKNAKMAKEEADRKQAYLEKV